MTVTQLPHFLIFLHFLYPGCKNAVSYTVVVRFCFTLFSDDTSELLLPCGDLVKIVMDMIDSSVAETQSHIEKREGSTPSTSGLGKDRSKSNKVSLKRTTLQPANKKSRKQQKATQLGYTVQQGEDMLLVISSSTSQYDGSVWTPPKRGNNKRKLTKGKGKSVLIKKKKTVSSKPKRESQATAEEDTFMYVPQNSTDYRWGQNLPEELLINIFQMVVMQDGPVPFLCR